MATDLKALEALPPSTTFRRIDFDTARVDPGFLPNSWFLTVNGRKPWASMTVELVPLVYVKRPDFWGIEVVAAQRGIGIPLEVPYSVVLEISNVLGTAGIEVIGATKSEKIKVGSGQDR
ncbi:MAG TPA: hypothetical protein VGC77_22635 [Rhodopseudomonas sp.]|uniref:hypothetical protein n=1 Tax=Rhodopseudomonas sp. TaxID=1078 RepID=UPI002ED7E756